MTPIPFVKTTSTTAIEQTTNFRLDDLYPVAGIVGIVMYILVACFSE